MPSYIEKVRNPDWYHGHGKKAPFFEGWYYKLISANEDHKFAFIPGVFINLDPEKTHAFIQVLDGINGTAEYHTYPLESFIAADDAFDIRVGENHFTREHITLHMGNGKSHFKGTLHFHDITPFPVTWTAPGIMGFFGWLPFMECNHGVVSLDHRIEGSLQINHQATEFSRGRGYIEKDWGVSFPSGYVWQQTNHFDTVGTSLTASIAVIPNFGFRFPGFIIGFWHKNVLYRFATYTGAKVKQLVVNEDTIRWVVADRNYLLEMESTRARGGLLMGPERSDMHKRVDETLDATVEVRFSTQKGGQKRIVFHEVGRNAGLEVVGDLSMLLKP